MDRRLRMALVLGSAAGLLVAQAGRAATEAVVFTPHAAVPGEVVSVYVDTFNCAIAETVTQLSMRLQPVNGPEYQATLVRAAPSGPFHFVVPEMPTGDYGAVLDCQPPGQSLHDHPQSEGLDLE